MRLFTKPEIHNVSYCRQKRTKPMWNLDVWLLRYTSGQTHRQTERQTRSLAVAK